jgi:hypothetical protein
MVVADDQLHAVQAALVEAGQKMAPVGFGFAQGDTDAKNGAFAVRADTQRDEHSAIANLTAMADLFITRIQDQIRAGTQRSGAPGFQFQIQSGGALADLSGTDGAAAKLFDDRGDFARRHPLDVHFSQRQFKGLLAAQAFVQGLWIEVDVPAYLGYGEGDRTQAGGESFVLEAVGVALTSVGPLVGLGLEDLGAFLAHGFIDEQLEAFGESLRALV